MLDFLFFSVVANFWFIEAHKAIFNPLRIQSLFSMLRLVWIFSLWGCCVFCLLFVNASLIFPSLQLHITTAPTYFHFPPSGKRKPEDQYDVARCVFYACLGIWIGYLCHYQCVHRIISLGPRTAVPINWVLYHRSRRDQKYCTPRKTTHIPRLWCMSYCT